MPRLLELPLAAVALPGSPSAIGLSCSPNSRLSSAGCVQQHGKCLLEEVVQPSLVQAWAPCEAAALKAAAAPKLFRLDLQKLHIELLLSSFALRIELDT